MKLMVDPNFPNHVKIRKLASLLKIDPYKAVGHVLAMWCGVLQQRESGDLRGWDSIDLALVSGWTSNAKEWLDGLTQVGLIEVKRGKLLVHEWLQHQGDLIQRRADWKERQKRHRDVTRMSRVTVTENGDSHASPSPPLPSPALPCPTIPREEKSGPPPVVSVLASTWNKGPGLHLNGDKAAAQIKAAIDVGVDPQKIEQAFMDHTKTKGLKLWDVLDPLRPQNGKNAPTASIEDLLRGAGEHMKSRGLIK